MNEPTSEQTADDLAAGREYIEAHGWTKYELEEPDGTVCAVGGLVRGMGLNPHTANMISNTRVRRAAEVLDRLIPQEVVRGATSVNTVTSWNDDHTDEVQEVLDLFAKAEKIQRMGYDPDLGYSDE